MSYNNIINNLKKEKRTILIIQLLTLFIFLITWQILSSLNIINSFIYSSPINIIKQIINLYNQNNLFNHIMATLYEIIISFIIGNVLGFTIAIFMYLFPIFAKIIDPFLTMLNSLPKVALGPIIIIIAGANIKSIILMAILINIIVTIISMYNGFINIDPLKIKMFKTFNANKKDILLKLVIPNSLTSLISSLKLTISLTLIGVITGEFLVSKEGIGYLIIYGSQVFNLDMVFSGIIILILISYLLYKIVSLIEKKYTFK